MVAQMTSPSTTEQPALRRRCQPFRVVWGLVSRAGLLVWKWSVPHRNSHRPDDEVYSSVWSINVDQDKIHAILHTAFPDVSQDELPTEEEHVRWFLRDRFPPPVEASGEPVDAQNPDTEKEVTVDMEKQRQKFLQEASEETWQHIPVEVRQALAAANTIHLERKLNLLLEEKYHPSAGLGSLTRSAAGIRKTFSMWRHGFTVAVSLRERIGVNVFFVILAFSAVYPDVAAGFLGERSYNQRSIGSRIVTLCQLFFLWTFPFHSFWLLFNWSLERLLGAFVGNSAYALVALVPAIRASYRETWFRTMMLVLSMCWQISVQFSPTVRDYLVRLVTRRQMWTLRKQTKLEDDIDWTHFDEMIKRELVSHRTFAEEQTRPGAAPLSWHDVPVKVRVERYIQFTSTFVHGRSADQLIGLLKDDMEGIINTYEDYRSSSNVETPGDKDKGHVEPRLPKFLLVFFDTAIFAYVCYSFWTQPFTFNTVVAYSTVVVIKQTIIALKRYQTIKSARRLFTNMVSINILGMLLVSTPVTIDRNVLAKDGNMVALTLAMVFATIFLAEPIAPTLLTLTEKGVSASSRVVEKIKHRMKKEEGEKGDE